MQPLACIGTPAAQLGVADIGLTVSTGTRSDRAGSLSSEHTASSRGHSALRSFEAGWDGKATVTVSGLTRLKVIVTVSG